MPKPDKLSDSKHPKPKPSEYVLELRFTDIGPHGQPRYRVTGRVGLKAIHDNKDVTAAELRRFISDWTNEMRSSLSDMLPILDAKIMADVEQYAAKHHLSRKQALSKMGIPATFRVRRRAA